MKNLFLFFLTALLFTACTAGKKEKEICLENINVLPLFGGQQRCPTQLRADTFFLYKCDRIYPDRKTATADMIRRGWNYLHEQKTDTAIIRFNQAWLLDSTHAGIYWGFGTALGVQKKTAEALPFFERSLQLAPDSAKNYLALTDSLDPALVNPEVRKRIEKK
jgi:tetratricopeptide (TPR) repeat protein